MLASMKRKRERTAAELNDRSDLVDAAQARAARHRPRARPADPARGDLLLQRRPQDGAGVEERHRGPLRALRRPDGRRRSSPKIRDYVPNLAIIFMTKAALDCEAAHPVRPALAARPRLGEALRDRHHQQAPPRLRGRLRPRALRVGAAASSRRCSSAARTGRSPTARCAASTARARSIFDPASGARSSLPRL